MGGPPSQYVLNMRWKIQVICVLQLVYSFGLLITMVVCALGFYSVSNGTVDARMVLFWGMMGFFQGIYAVAHFIDGYFRGRAFTCLTGGCDNHTLTWVAVLLLMGPIAMVT